ncbi:CCR4-Not complex subunit Not3/5 [Schizosaccharomyces japonicus yFS275]|uniref:General negative regulator of transcription subunit n=1 Tax=Schizosaccharomyces japonicus (strain yFS275 / FY16936) TaxID=402676 RepID=B6K6L5_SCHJY|nr:CCR4-Not complex subunit Not3/5 [Schizosaccharomyces japonicus yFS275]EEB09169.1 CCR4-Not complex subunit Not3/5 [Schizosaccharomyces japonicus yFS275]
MTARKLQVEIEKTFKKVTDGIAIFDEVYEKLNASTSPSQKEKLEGDLKTQIKKLQRLRDQIKAWASSNDIKDKKALMENRRLIEAKMEEFKAVEREMKIKAFSKEGLSAATKMDPKEKEKNDTVQWIANGVEELERQIEQMEAETEIIRVSMKKGKKDMSKISQLNALEDRIERHKWHQEKLELLMRRLENNQLTAEAINNIQDDILYYIESNQDVDFAEDFNIYDELGLDDAPISNSAELKKSSESSSPLNQSSSTDGSDETQFVSVNTPPSQSPGAQTPEPSSSVQKSKEETRPKEPVQVLRLSHSSKTPSSSPKPNAIASPHVNASPSTPTHTPSVALHMPKPELRYASAAAAAAAALRDAANHSTARSNSPSSPYTATVITSRHASTALQHNSATTAAKAEPSAVAKVSKPAEDVPVSATGTSTAAAASNGASTAAKNAPPVQVEQLPTIVQDLYKTLSGVRKQVQSSNKAEENGETSREDKSKLYELLDTSCLYVPDSVDASKPRYYIPKDPYPVPHYYPQQPLPLFDSPEIVERADPDTLFFMFYYLPGTYQQYLAGKELKRQSWRFHKKYMTWFQRHDEPKVITDEYESGTYRYFDFEGNWVQRKKSDFRFQYQYLEDEDDWSR